MSLPSNKNLMPNSEISPAKNGGRKLPAYPESTTTLPPKAQRVKEVLYGRRRMSLLSLNGAGVHSLTEVPKRVTRGDIFNTQTHTSVAHPQDDAYVQRDTDIPETVRVGEKEYIPYPLRTESVPKNPKRRKEQRRRTRMKAGRIALAGLALIAAAERVNVAVSSKVTPVYATNLTEVMDNSPVHAEQHSATIYFGGLGQTDAIADFEDLRHAQQKRPDIVFAVGYSSKGIDIPKEASLIEQEVRQDNITELNGVGDSSGGNIMLRVFKMVKEKFKNNIHFGTLTEIDSPTTSDDILNRNYHIALLFGNSHIANLLGRGGKFIGEAYTYMISNGEYLNMLHGLLTDNFSTIKQQFDTAWRVTKNKLTPTLWLSQLGVDASSTLKQTASALAVIDPQYVDYVEPEVASHDTTVNVTTSVTHLEEALREEAVDQILHNNGHIGVRTPPAPPTQLVIIQVPHASHASLGTNTISYNTQLGKHWEKEVQESQLHQPNSDFVYYTSRQSHT